jgi:hypothetical protein
MYFQVPNYRHGEKQTETIHDWIKLTFFFQNELSPMYHIYITLP